MSKTIRDQLATVQRMIDEILRSSPTRVDDFRSLAALTEAQLNLVRALDGASQPAERPSAITDSSWWSNIFSVVDGERVVSWPVEDWECPACGGKRFMVQGAPPASVVRPHPTEKAWVHSGLGALCDDCGLACSVDTAARSWHMEQAGLEPHPEIAAHREGLT